jgi:hypothetical protein
VAQILGQIEASDDDAAEQLLPLVALIALVRQSAKDA